MAAFGLCSQIPVDMKSVSVLDQSDIHSENMQYDNDVFDDKQFDPDYREERFRVDRKKLEQMLHSGNSLVVGSAGNDDAVVSEEAEKFFRKVMEETDTQITWPSKLKIGAKSKKDPHIKVCGKLEAVCAAKEKILCVLDTKSNKVTLKMDVSHTDHSHVIGKGGNNIKGVMHDTGCHIHFPDSNRTNQTQDKSNQVSIAGQPEGVEQARVKIRELLPFTLMFDLAITLPADTTAPIIQQIQQLYNVTVTFKVPRPYSTSVIVRGCVNNVKAVKEATAYLVDQLTGNRGLSLPVTTQLEIAPQHHQFILGRSGINITQIMQSTGANIYFPGFNAPQGLHTHQNRGTVYISGGIDSVYLARQYLIDCLPLVLMFDMKEDIEVDQASISELKEQLDVFISVKPKVKQPNKSVIIKSIERNAHSMYTARCKLLGLETQSDKLQSNLNQNVMGLLSANLLNMRTTSPLVLMNNSQASIPNHTSQGTHITNSLYSGGTMMLGSPSALSIYPGSHKAPHSPVRNHSNVSSPVLAPRNSTSSHVQSQPQSPCSPKRVPGIHDDGMGSLRSSRTSSLSSSPHDLINNTNMEYGESSVFSNTDILHRTHKLHSNSTNDLLARTGGTINNPAMATSITGGQLSSSTSSLPSRHSSISGTSLCNSLNSTFHDDPLPSLQDLTINSAGLDSDITHLPTNLFEAAGMFPEDYERKKIMASKAIQKKAVGECTPTPVWSGLGFSQSTPDSAFRDRLRQNNVNTYTGPSNNTNTIYESAVTEEGVEIDGDPWKNSNHKTNADAGISQLDTSEGVLGSPKHTHGGANWPQKPLMQNHSSNHSSTHLSQSHQSSHLNSSQTSPPSVKQQHTLAELFTQIGMVKYISLFQQQEIDIATFLTLTEPDLKELGIPTFGARRKIILTIADLQKHLSSTSTSNNRPPGAPGSPSPGTSRHSEHPWMMNPASGNDSLFRDSRAMHQKDIISQSGIW